MRVLRALAAGDAERARDGGRELALQVLQSTELGRRAIAVLREGEHMDVRIADLCEALLNANNENEGKRNRTA